MQAMENAEQSNIGWDDEEVDQTPIVAATTQAQESASIDSRDNEVQVPSVVEEIMSFEQMGLSRQLLRGIYSCGYNHPSPIQRKGIAPIMRGGHVLAQACSGSGKTAMFSIGTLHNIDASVNKCQAIFLSPTRDLALQTLHVVRTLSCFLPEVRVAEMIGGTSVEDHRQSIRRQVPHIVVGTPGRVLHMILSRALQVDGMRTIVFDEADEMLTRGFRDQIIELFKSLPTTIQIVFCSATMPQEAVDISLKLMRQCTKILIPKEEVTLKGIQQFYVEVDERQKTETLLDLYSHIPITQSVVFCNTKKRVDIVAGIMRERGHSVSTISSDMPIAERMDVMSEYRNGRTRILISSNLLARGIDVQQVGLVINYDLPSEKESYIHRIGRSGRYGRRGVAINLVSSKDSQKLADIIEHYRTEVNELPSSIESLFEMNPSS